MTKTLTPDERARLVAESRHDRASALTNGLELVAVLPKSYKYRTASGREQMAGHDMLMFDVHGRLRPRPGIYVGPSATGLKFRNHAAKPGGKPDYMDAARKLLYGDTAVDSDPTPPHGTPRPEHHDGIPPLALWDTPPAPGSHVATGKDIERLGDEVFGLGRLLASVNRKLDRLIRDLGGVE